MKKYLSFFLTAAILICNISTSAAVQESNTHDAAFEEIKNSYIELCDEMGSFASEAEIFETFLEQNPSLEIVSYSESYFDENGIQVIPTRCQPTQLNMMRDYFIFDDDSQLYVYFGYWEWNTRDLHLARCDDIVSFVSQQANPGSRYYYESPTSGSANYAVYGYNINGLEVATYDPKNNDINGIARVDLSSGDEYGAAFYINDNIVRSGRIIVPVSFSNQITTRVRTVYQHNWSETTITSLGVNVALRNQTLSFSGSWNTNVERWEDPVRSEGAILNFVG